MLFLETRLICMYRLVVLFVSVLDRINHKNHIFLINWLIWGACVSYNLTQRPGLFHIVRDKPNDKIRKQDLEQDRRSFQICQFRHQLASIDPRLDLAVARMQAICL
jgi:hypothetical protein